jgi:DNA-directed RNA polymerase alpha subunit
VAVPGRRRRKTGEKHVDMTGWSEDEVRDHQKQVRLRTPVAEMDLPVRVVNVLEENNIIMAVDLLHQTYESLTTMKNFGDKTLDDVRDAIRKLGLDPPEWARPARLREPPASHGKARSLFD